MVRNKRLVRHPESNRIRASVPTPEAERTMGGVLLDTSESWNPIRGFAKAGTAALSWKGKRKTHPLITQLSMISCWCDQLIELKMALGHN